MRLGILKELLLGMVKSYFPDSMVVFSNQSRAPKPNVPLLVLAFGNASRPLYPVQKIVNGHVTFNYETTVPVTIDLFTNGAPVINPSAQKVVGYVDTAVDDMLAFADFINSDHIIDWSRGHDIAILIDGEVQNLTGAVNDNNYEYRARMSLLVRYTQTSIGHAGVLTEDSVQYPDGEGGYTTVPPTETESTTGGWITEAEEKEKEAIIVPAFKPTPSGGGSQELADEVTGYFTEAEIKEENE